MTVGARESPFRLRWAEYQICKPQKKNKKEFFLIFQSTYLLWAMPTFHFLSINQSQLWLIFDQIKFAFSSFWIFFCHNFFWYKIPECRRRFRRSLQQQGGSKEINDFLDKSNCFLFAKKVLYWSQLCMQYVCTISTSSFSYSMYTTLNNGIRELWNGLSSVLYCLPPLLPGAWLQDDLAVLQNCGYAQV